MREGEMKRSHVAGLLVLLFALPSLARVVRVAELPASEFADTEVSTNVVAVVDESVSVDTQGPVLMIFLR